MCRWDITGNKKMKKLVKAVFMLSLMALPFIFTSCEKDYGTSGYGHHNDSDWKLYNNNDQANPSIDYEEAVLPIDNSAE